MITLCPFCEAVHPVGRAPHLIRQELDCPCGAIGLLCAPNTEAETSVRPSEGGFGDTKADVLSETRALCGASPGSGAGRRAGQLPGKTCKPGFSF